MDLSVCAFSLCASSHHPELHVLGISLPRHVLDLPLHRDEVRHKVQALHHPSLLLLLVLEELAVAAGRVLAKAAPGTPGGGGDFLESQRKGTINQWRNGYR